MPLDKLNILTEEGGHPSLELLRQYHEDALAHSQSHQVEKHLLHCDLCSDILEGMAMSEAESTKAAVADIHVRLDAKLNQEKKRSGVPAWQIAAAVLLMICTASVVLFYNYRNLQQEQNIVSTGQEINKAMVSPQPPSAPSIGAVDSVKLPDTLSIAIAMPSEKKLKRAVPVVVHDSADETAIVCDLPAEDLVFEDEEEIHKQTQEILAGIDAPSPSRSTPTAVSDPFVTEAAPVRLNSLAETAPESTNVSMALQGKAAGITIRGMSTLKKGANANVVQGRVLSEDGQPLPGVAVRIKGTNTGTVTDGNGTYTLPLTGGKPTLLFSFIGYETAEKGIAAYNVPVEVTMTPDNKALSEVVVTGYGVSKSGKAPTVVSAKPAMGWKSYNKYLRENLRVPANSEFKKGTVKVGFTVKASGGISQVRVLKSLCAACDTEAIRLVTEGPAWTPATQGGLPVEQQVKVSVRFRR
ncbi:carboxypeptidase-like regulatory domain-containing protein [Pontibacter korlensis]|uniref:TonB C-terminal domain-containing protein n=1 Tax=Pontibacter korlensis TaxID=400092 RepID=A0A0E3ZGL9_9BACT|nr:carboxypeptidase-like regulatory domain-containing protein [Pontibacter korlensis]AKD04215.1 hypothetical protein PKOR_15360 [Pontibacter korlensis]